MGWNNHQNTTLQQQQPSRPDSHKVAESRLKRVAKMAGMCKVLQVTKTLVKAAPSTPLLSSVLQHLEMFDPRPTPA